MFQFDKLHFFVTFICYILFLGTPKSSRRDQTRVKNMKSVLKNFYDTSLLSRYTKVFLDNVMNVSRQSMCLFLICILLWNYTFYINSSAYFLNLSLSPTCLETNFCPTRFPFNNSSVKINFFVLNLYLQIGRYFQIARLF